MGNWLEIGHSVITYTKPIPDLSTCRLFARVNWNQCPTGVGSCSEGSIPITQVLIREHYITRFSMKSDLRRSMTAVHSSWSTPKFKPTSFVPGSVLQVFEIRFCITLINLVDLFVVWMVDHQHAISFPAPSCTRDVPRRLFSSLAGFGQKPFVCHKALIYFKSVFLLNSACIKYSQCL